MIAFEVQTEEHGRWLLRCIGEIKEQVHFPPVGVAREVNADLLPHGLALKRAFDNAAYLEGHVGRSAGHFSINELLEELQNLGPAMLPPSRRISDRPTIRHDQRIRQPILGHLAFIDVLRPLFADRRAGQEQRR